MVPTTFMQAPEKQKPGKGRVLVTVMQSEKL